jgi:hypothetical protein
MLTTTGRNDFGIELYGTQSLEAVSGSPTSPPYFANDATVTIYPGVQWYNNTLIPWDGTQTQVNRLSNFSGTSADATHWQSTLLFLKKEYFYQLGDTMVGLDMTRTCSPTAASRAAIVPPTSGNRPIGLFTLYSTTGSDSTLVEYIRY